MREYWNDPPVQKENPTCPVCGEECETIYTDPCFHFLSLFKQEYHNTMKISSSYVCSYICSCALPNRRLIFQRKRTGEGYKEAG